MVTTVNRGSVGVRPKPTPPLGTLNVTEVIGGETAELWESLVNGTEYTGVAWETRRIYFEGTSLGQQGASRQFMVYQTVQFADRRQ